MKIIQDAIDVQEVSNWINTHTNWQSDIVRSSEWKQGACSDHVTANAHDWEDGDPWFGIETNKDFREFKHFAQSNADLISYEASNQPSNNSTPPQSIKALARESFERFPEHQDIIIDAYDLLKEELEENPAAEELIIERFQDFIKENIPEVSENPFHARSLEHHLRKWMQENYPFEGKTGKEWAESTHSKLIDILNYKVYSPETNYKDTTQLALKFHHLSGDSTPSKQLFREAFKYTFEHSMVVDTINKLDHSIIGSLENLQFIKDATADLLNTNPHFSQAFSPYSAVTDTLTDTPVNALPAKIISTAVSNKLSNDEFISHNLALVDLCLSIDTEYRNIFTPSNSSDFSRVHQKYLDNLNIDVTKGSESTPTTPSPKI